MKALAMDGLVDARADIPRQAWEIGRAAKKTSITLHYNGPKIAGVEKWTRERLLRFIREADVPEHIGPRLKADGLQYHFVVAPNGEVLQTRDLDAILWHCANATGNKSSIAIHLPLGIGQTPTAPQWASTTGLFDRLIRSFPIPGRNAVYGHTEWAKFQNVGGRLIQVPNSTCPGPILMAMLRTWRAPALRFRVVDPTGANVRIGPSRQLPKALGDTAWYFSGYEFDAQDIVYGESVGGDTRWAHVAGGIGFVHLSTLRAL